MSIWEDLAYFEKRFQAHACLTSPCLSYLDKSSDGRVWSVCWVVPYKRQGFLFQEGCVGRRKLRCPEDITWYSIMFYFYLDTWHHNWKYKKSFMEIAIKKNKTIIKIFFLHFEKKGNHSLRFVPKNTLKLLWKYLLKIWINITNFSCNFLNWIKKIKLFCIDAGTRYFKSNNPNVVLAKIPLPKYCIQILQAGFIC